MTEDTQLLLICLPFMIIGFLVQYGLPLFILFFIIRAIVGASHKDKKQKNINPEATNISLDENNPVINYIVMCRNTRTMGDEVIYANLKNAGWKDVDIENAFKLSANKI